MLPLFEFHAHPDYLSWLGATSEDLRNRLMQVLTDEFDQPTFQQMTTLASRIATDATVGRYKTGLITLLAQMMYQLPHAQLMRQLPQKEAIIVVGLEPFLLVALDILQIAERSQSTSAEAIQVARSYWVIGKQAKSEGVPELSVTCYTRAAETYVSQSRWQQVGDLYWNLGLAEAAAGFKPNGVGWMHIAQSVFSSIGQESVALEAASVAADMTLRFEKYSLVRQRSEQALALLRSVHDRVLHSTRFAAEGKPLPSFIMLTEIPGVGRVATQGVQAEGWQAWRHSSALADEIEYCEARGWPQGLIAAQAVDLRLIGRIVQEPSPLDSMEPRALEVAIGRIMEGFGASVRVTPPTRDGGYDVESVFQLGAVKYRILFEAKKWSVERHVGIEVVDRLLGVQRRLGADHVCLVTTSTFSSIARREAARMRSEVTLLDRGQLLTWAREFLLPQESSLVTLPSLRLKRRVS